MYPQLEHPKALTAIPWLKSTVWFWGFAFARNTVATSDLLSLGTGNNSPFLQIGHVGFLNIFSPLSKLFCSILREICLLTKKGGE